MDLKFFTSYFYQVRFFQPYMLPISTALSDPKWFHDWKGKYNVFKDKRGIYNGIRCENLHFHSDEEVACGETCPMDPKDPTKCSFLTAYRKQLFENDFEEFYQNCERISHFIFSNEGIKEVPHIILMVYETPSNLCSERAALQDWIRANGFSCNELQYPISTHYKVLS